MITILDQLFFDNANIIYFFYKTSYFNEEVDCTEPSLSVSVPWIEPILNGILIEGHVLDTYAEMNFGVVHLAVVCDRLKQNKNTEFASNKSSSLLKILIQNTQTLQLFSMNHKTESTYNGFKKSKTVRQGSSCLIKRARKQKRFRWSK